MSDMSNIIQNLLHKLVEKIEDYSIIFEKDSEGLIGDVIFVTLSHKKNNQKMYYVIKQSRQSVAHSEIVFVNEITIYGVVWPKFVEFWKRQLGKPMPEFLPNCFAVFNDPHALVLQDLRTEGFVSHPKTEPLNGNLYELIFDKYGVFHAMTLVFKLSKPEEFKNLTKNLKGLFGFIFSEKRVFMRISKQYLEEFKDQFWEEQYKELRGKIEDFIKNAHFIVGEAVRYDKDNCWVLHGDSWSNNMFFKYDVSKSRT